MPATEDDDVDIPGGFGRHRVAVIVTLPHASRVRGGSTSSRWRQIVDAQGPGRTEISAGVVHAVSLRLREQALGAMNLFSSEPVGLGQPDRTIAQALAEVATVAILGQSPRSCRLP